MTFEFDCSVDLTAHIVPPGVLPAEAVDRVRAAIEHLPDANWVSVEWCGTAPPALPWLRLYRPGDGNERAGGAWDTLAAKVREEVLRALAAPPTR